MLHAIRSKILYILSNKGFARYIENTGWLFGGKIISLLASFFVSVYVVRYLGPFNNGLLAYSASVAGIFGFLTNLGVDQILNRDLVLYPEKKRSLLGTAFFMKTIGGIYALTATLIFAFLSGASGLISLLVFINAFSFVFQAFNVINYHFQAKVLSKYPTILYLIVIVLLSILKIYFVITQLDIIYFALLILLEPILYAIGYYWLYAFYEKESVFQWKIDNSIAKQMLSYSWPLMLSGIFVTLYTRIDQVMIGQFLDTASVGIYDVAARLSEVWYFIPALIASSFFPAILNAKKVNETLYHERLRKLYSVIFYLGLAIIVPVCVFSETIVQMLYGTEYGAAASILRIYSLSTIAVFMGTIVNQYLISENRTFILFASSFCGMFLNVVLNLLFIPRFGMEGAAAATFVSYLMIPLSIIFFKTTRSHVRIMWSGVVLKKIT